jgi:serine/threonine protein kinase
VETGSRLGPYEVIAPLGAGGMGEVYHARDTRLDRDVAIKILTASLGADPRRRERFEREARIISSLNHPNICALFDVGRDGDHDFLVLEYLEGEPLDRRLAALKGRPLPLKQALLIAAQIADGLDKAHRAGVVHRDLKPQNIFLTKNGAKLLDFGLAKMATTSPDSVTDPPSVTPPSVRPPLCNVTIDGTIVGTFFYMAPEQLAGRDADARTDIYAFGLVLYEMVTGQRPFDREGDTGVITAVFEREPPPLSAVVATLPVTLDRIVRTCLAKDPDDRFQSAHDLLLQLRWAAESALDQAEDARPARRWRIAAFAAFAVAAAFAGRPLLSRVDPPAPTAIERFAYQMPADQIFTRAGRRPLAVSPDGARLTYAANGQLFLKSIEDLEAKPIPGTDDDPSDPSFSPDGSAIMYWSRRSGEIHTIPTSGGGATRIAKTLNPWGSSWSGTRLFVSEGAKGILELSAAGGSTRRIVPAVNGESLYGPELLPDGDTLLFTVKPANASRWDDAMIAAQSAPAKCSFKGVRMRTFSQER